MFELIPVDYCARVIAKLALQSTTLGKTFHLEGRQQPPTQFCTVAEMLSRALTDPTMNTLGINESKPLEALSFEQWHARLEEAARVQFRIGTADKTLPSAAVAPADPSKHAPPGTGAASSPPQQQNRLAPLLPYFAHGFASGAPFSCTKTRELLAQDAELAHLPTLDRALLWKYICFYKQTGQI